MLTGFLELVETSSVDSGDDDLDHCYCELCHPEGDKALCGSNTEGDFDFSDDEDWQPNCVVCLNLSKCPECGDRFD